jgi:hypothetical protein
MNGARTIFRIPNLILALSVVAILGLIALAGCSDNNNPANPGGGGASTSSFTGIFSSPAQSGKLSVTINTTSLAGRGIIKRAGRGIVTCSGTADFGASAINVAGTYDTSIDGFTLTGGGYTFDGTYQIAQGKPTLQGFWDGPGGSGGDFTCYIGNNTTVTVYCGRYHSNAADGDSMGNWTFGVVDTLLAGYAFGDSSNANSGIFFEGKVSATGNPRIININYSPSQYTLVAPGTIDTTGVDAVNGAFTLTPTVGSGVSGTYTGSLCP